MKKLILILICSVCFLFVNAQTQYKRCLDDGIVRWSFALDVIDLGLCSVEIAAFGDTLINNVLWKKIYDDGYGHSNLEDNDTNWLNYTPVLYYRTQFFIRESEDASKMYMFDSFQNREYLVSDLNLQVGDTFRLPFYYYEYLVLVDSVYLKDGLKHVRLDDNYQYGDGKLTFIEGVGLNTRFVNLIWGGGPSVLHCFQNQTLFYKYFIYNSVYDFPCGYCNEPLSVFSILENQSKIIVEKGEILISSLPNDSQIFLYNINGILQYKKENISQDAIIPTSALPKGVYILKIFDKESNQSSVTKIIL